MLALLAGGNGDGRIGGPSLHRETAVGAGGSVLVALGVLVGGLVPNGSALLAYAVVTVVLERAERSDPGRDRGDEPPKGPG